MEHEFGQTEAEAFLCQPHVGVLAVATDASPAAVPLWYDCTDDVDEVWVLTPTATRKARWLERQGRATLVVQTVTPRLRFVSVDLELQGHRPAGLEDVRAMAARYLEGEVLEGYLQFAAEHLQEERYSFRPTRWRFGDLTM